VTPRIVTSGPDAPAPGAAHRPARRADGAGADRALARPRAGRGRPARPRARAGRPAPAPAAARGHRPGSRPVHRAGARDRSLGAHARPAGARVRALGARRPPRAARAAAAQARARAAPGAGAARRSRPAQPPAAPVPAGAGVSRGTFPVAGPFTWGDGVGADRGTHAHQGQDLLAAAGTPVVAPSGTIRVVGRAGLRRGPLPRPHRRRAGGASCFFAHCWPAASSWSPGQAVAARCDRCARSAPRAAPRRRTCTSRSGPRGGGPPRPRARRPAPAARGLARRTLTPLGSYLGELGTNVTRAGPVLDSEPGRPPRSTLR
jgi:hypothetical protein